MPISCAGLRPPLTAEGELAGPRPAAQLDYARRGFRGTSLAISGANPWGIAAADAGEAGLTVPLYCESYRSGYQARLSPPLTTAPGGFRKPATPFEINRFSAQRGYRPPFSDSASIGCFSLRGDGVRSPRSGPALSADETWYGTSGNSFVAVVEFGDRVSARAVTAGGESGHPGSPHFNDQAERYAAGNLRDVYFWPDQLRAHTERTYRPGE